MDELRRLLRYARPYRARLAAGVSALAMLGLAEGVIALMITPLLDRILNPASDDPRLPLVRLPGSHTIYLNSFVPSHIRWVWTVFSVVLVVLFIGKAIAEYLGVVQVQYVGQAAVTDLRNQVYEKLVRQPIGFLQQQATGRLISAVINDVERVRSTLSESLALFFRHIFTLFFLVVVLFLTNWRMALGSAVLLPLVLWPVSRLGKRIRRSTESSQSHLGELSQILQETLSGNRVVKAFGMEHFEIERFRAAARRLLRENMRWIRFFVISGPMMDLLSAVVIALVLLYARDAIKHGGMTIGAFGTFVYALFKAYEPVKGIGTVYQQFEQTRGATTQVFAFLALQEEVEEHSGARMLPPFAREVEFDNASFAYERASPILRNICLRARAGEVIAVVGSSGAGKTTLVNLLPRFYDVSGGTLRIDGIDVRDATLRSLREQMAIVTQETILFNDTVWNNICYGQPNLPHERVIAAARAAMAHDFIMALPQGYATMLGERGQRLSGGQRQRLAIARALLKDSPILILDEATSELDSESEMLVQKALANLMTARTVFVIAHRLSTIRRADNIVVLDDGRICETGTHQELLARNGIYARLYELQFADSDTAPSPAGPIES
jgi:subfamily B ATP-binding cassette protein MsbA